MNTSYTPGSQVPTSWKLIYRALGLVIVLIFMGLMWDKIDHYFYGTRPLIPFVLFCTLTAFAGAVALWHIGSEYRIAMLLAHVGYGAVVGGAIVGVIFCPSDLFQMFLRISLVVGIPCNVLSAVCIGTLKNQARQRKTSSPFI
jgi:peptidoglycan/LPS O-acetylase OafA/YrhL